mmetsp:Transcript_12986/g.31323  ORF Transcript_12986/g.31323 Transcript_12986/m.31323 type:complete len:249 (+) Transcript_12986:1388-2134(+)
MTSSPRYSKRNFCIFEKRKVEKNLHTLILHIIVEYFLHRTSGFCLQTSKHCLRNSFSLNTLFLVFLGVCCSRSGSFLNLCVNIVDIDFFSIITLPSLLNFTSYLAQLRNSCLYITEVCRTRGSLPTTRDETFHSLCFWLTINALLFGNQFHRLFVSEVFDFFVQPCGIVVDSRKSRLDAPFYSKHFSKRFFIAVRNFEFIPRLPVFWKAPRISHLSAIGHDSTGTLEFLQLRLHLCKVHANTRGFFVF